MQDIENELWRIRREMEDNRNEMISDLRRLEARVDALMNDIRRDLEDIRIVINPPTKQSSR